MDNNNLVSIVIPTYNRGNILNRCVGSIINQTYRPIEIIIVNDGDEQITNQWDHITDNISIRIINNPYNLGACISRNIGIANSKGTYITLCDDDDEFVTDRIETFVNKFNNTNSFGIFSDYIVKSTDKTKITDLPKIVDQTKILYGNYVGSQFFTKKEFLKEIQFDRKFLASQDHDFITQFILKFHYLEKISTPTYISHQDSSIPRVSNNIILGRIQYYLKYRKLMTLKHRITFFLKIIRVILIKSYK